MCCFIAPVTEAIITTILGKVIEGREGREMSAGNELPDMFPKQIRIPFSRKMKWLSNMLWGGSALLVFEHVWHGEFTPWFPFFTAAGNPEALSQMLSEVLTVGVGMTVLVTAVWGCMVFVSGAIEKKAAQSLSENAAVSQGG